MDIRCMEHKWEDCSELIRSFTQGNRYITPYSYYDFLSSIMNHPNVHKRREFRRYTFRCFVCYRGDTPCLVAPLLVNEAEKRLALAGSFSSVGHSDFIYDSAMVSAELWQCIEALSAQFPGYLLSLNQISEFSLTATAMQERRILPQVKDICVKIDISEYDAWYSGLSKSCRQNIRTSYNRLKSDEVQTDFFLYVNKKPEKKLINDNIRLFSKRILEHMKLPKLLALPMRLYKRNEAMTKALFSASENIFASVYLNGKLAASCNGVIANDGRAIITRLSIETDLKKYSPGGVLLNELIKACCKDYPFIRSIDLSRGDEPYKYVYGGIEHHNYSYELSL